MVYKMVFGKLVNIIRELDCVEIHYDEPEYFSFSFTTDDIDFSKIKYRNLIKELLDMWYWDFSPDEHGLDDINLSRHRLMILIGLLSHADFSNVQRDPVPPELDRVRPDGVSRFYGFYSVMNLLCPNNIDEVVFLEDLLEKGKVFTADAALADLVVQKYNAGEDFSEELEAYRKSIVEVKDVDDYPIYWTTVYNIVPVTMPSNEFMFIPGGD